MSDQEYEDIEKIFGGSWRVDRDENLEDFMTAAGNRVFLCPSTDTTVMPAKSDRDVMFCLQCYQGLIIDRSLVY